jgi:hypothetical protein
LVFFLALGLVLDAWLKPVLETTLDVPGLLASLTSGAARPKGLCSAFDGSRMISIRLTHIYLSILNIYSYSYIYIYLSIYLSIPPLNPGIYILGKKLLDLNPSTLRAICGKAVESTMPKLRHVETRPQRKESLKIQGTRLPGGIDVHPPLKNKETTVYTHFISIYILLIYIYRICTLYIIILFFSYKDMESQGVHVMT